MYITLSKEVKKIEYTDHEIPKYIVDAIDQLVRCDKKISAIKLLRGYLNRNDDVDHNNNNIRPGQSYTCGLKEAKDYVEQFFPVVNY